MKFRSENLFEFDDYLSPTVSYSYRVRHFFRYNSRYNSRREHHDVHKSLLRRPERDLVDAELISWPAGANATVLIIHYYPSQDSQSLKLLDLSR